MKKFTCYLTLILLVSSCANKITREQNLRLKKAYAEKNYFVLDNLMSKIAFDKFNPDLILYQATLYNVFNKPMPSNQLLNQLIKNYPTYFNDSIMRDIYRMKVDNDVRTEDYAAAFQDNNQIISKYRHVCDSAELASGRNDSLVFRNLAGAPKMMIRKEADASVRMKRDRLGLYNVPVAILNDTVDFIFDTGANFSVINETLAAKYGVKMLGEKIQVGASTGKHVESRMGLLDFNLGSIELKNVIFLVIPDSALIFAGGAFQIRGIVGFPVMNALREFVIKDDKFLIVPKKPTESADRNFALEGLTPMIMVKYNNDTLPFRFDTGATNTDLYSSFFNKYKISIISQCKKEKRLAGGAGGDVETEVYVLCSAVLSAGNSQCKIDSLDVHEKDLMGNDVKYAYGNFGQDYIKKFNEMRINFASMHISFESRKE